MVNHHTRVDEGQEISCPRWQRTNSLTPKMIYEIWGSGKPVSFLWLSFLHVCLKKYAGEMRGATSFLAPLKDELTRVIVPLDEWSEVKDSRKTDTCLHTCALHGYRRSTYSWKAGRVVCGVRGSAGAEFTARPFHRSKSPK